MASPQEIRHHPHCRPMHIEQILVLEDNKEILQSIKEVLLKLGYMCDSAENLHQAREILQTKDYDLVLADIHLPDGTGIDLLKEHHSIKEFPLFIMMSENATVESAIEAMRLGAANHLIKPFHADQLEIAIKQLEALKRLTTEANYFRNRSKELPDLPLVGKGSVMQDLRRLIQQVGATDAVVLIQGESGTGKELVARSLVAASPRSNKPYIKLNCAAIPENLIESELFGHEKGAFTGAAFKRIGRFETADGGTLMLDEISEIPLPLQAKLLRVMQEREFERVGGNRPIHVDVRILATTNRDLNTAVKEGNFREDLFYRLNVVPIHVPPLRDREGDIDLVLDHFLEYFAKHHSKAIPQISSEAREAIRHAPWPGNVRELQNSVERAVILASPTHRLQAADFGLVSQIPISPIDLMAQEDYSLQNMEKLLIERALKKTKDNITQAAKLLGISLRTLHYKLSEKRSSQSVSDE